MTQNKKSREKYNLIATRHRRLLKQKACIYKGGCCEMCGYSKVFSALCFHHKDPTKKDFGISERTKSNWDSLRKEIDKCLLLCVRCHVEIHEEQFLEKVKLLEEKCKIQDVSKNGMRKCIACKNHFESNKKQRKCSDCLNSNKINKRNRSTLNIDDITTLCKMHDVAEVAKIKNCSKQKIKLFCKKNKIKTFNPPRKTKIEWPPNDILQELVNSKSLVSISKDLGVSDNAIKKRCIRNGIKLKRK